MCIWACRKYRNNPADDWRRGEVAAGSTAVDTRAAPQPGSPRSVLQQYLWPSRKQKVGNRSDCDCFTKWCLRCVAQSLRNCGNCPLSYSSCCTCDHSLSGMWRGWMMTSFERRTVLRWQHKNVGETYYTRAGNSQPIRQPDCEPSRAEPTVYSTKYRTVRFMYGFPRLWPALQATGERIL